MKKYTFISFFVLYFIMSTLSWATIQVDLKPSRLHLGETCRLTFTIDDLNSSGTPNLMGLQADFHIVGTEHRVSYTLIQGDMRAISQWSIVLSPRHTGRLTIPAIPIGSEHSEPMTLLVLGQAAS